MDSPVARRHHPFRPAPSQSFLGWIFPTNLNTKLPGIHGLINICPVYYNLANPTKIPTLPPHHPTPLHQSYSWLSSLNSTPIQLLKYPLGEKGTRLAEVMRNRHLLKVGIRPPKPLSSLEGPASTGTGDLCWPVFNPNTPPAKHPHPGGSLIELGCLSAVLGDHLRQATYNQPTLSTMLAPHLWQ
ncbi:hypothetical protein DSO57_1014519 [Entomophthora muscae]|uniref:Uncharacterized protein n=1 Tax=Entomophthora muscae TaxID=34485 RepID=A0ACC2T5G4_9FUNG|nr:hypothetical protein DSO57_1014519 [Entomophthora muscae]